MRKRNPEERVAYAHGYNDCFVEFRSYLLENKSIEESIRLMEILRDTVVKSAEEELDKFVDYLDYTCGLAGRTGSDKRTLKEKLKKFIHGEDYTR